MKKILFFMITITTLWSQNSFERNCIPCHTERKVSLQKSYMNALLVYGGKKNMKAALEYYFRYPNKSTSVMDEEFIRKYGIKEPMRLYPKEMDEALDAYWDRYSVMGKLR